MSQSSILRRSLAIFFIGGGINHFVSERFYTAIVPRSLPYKREIVQISGVAEVAGGVGVLIPGTRKLAGKCLIALLLAVYPANIQMAFNPDRYKQLPPWALWARLPLQFVFIAWSWAATQRD